MLEKIFIVCLFLLLAISVFYLLKFARIIMSIEDVLGDSIEQLNKTIDVINELEGMKLFYENEGIKPLVIQLVEQIRMSKYSILQMSKRFTELSKQKFILEEEDEENEKE